VRSLTRSGLQSTKYPSHRKLTFDKGKLPVCRSGQHRPRFSSMIDRVSQIGIGPGLGTPLDSGHLILQQVMTPPITSAFIHEIPAYWAGATPHAVCLYDTDTTVSYGELWERVQ